jgi:hypothetical protein
MSYNNDLCEVSPSFIYRVLNHFVSDGSGATRGLKVEDTVIVDILAPRRRAKKQIGSQIPTATLPPTQMISARFVHSMRVLDVAYHLA